MVLRPRRPSSLSLKISSIEVKKKKKMEMERKWGVRTGNLRAEREGKISLLLKLVWLLFEILWVKYYRWVWNRN